jgi:hypothetical protein
LIPIGPENKVAESEIFSSSKNSHLSHHVPPHIHHEFTTKIPPKNTRFSRTPSKNARETSKNWSRRALQIFFQKLSKF